ncbi:sodium/glutamate symporter [Rhodopirellula sp. MGV]|uniref:sodium/glutamate symporter n=1 Tax=Rhodopirellula sp. MGV TaxID=2023130 RepID=UPI000B95DABE|nr:hypothetical protein [Rhodopirellula sp. MGV]OYP29849.1 hypothetical protein CGZ80_23965 [Rhodopirellula sp. MGV]PNY33731.1 sodium:glutamate symporter [Rhodopirellula baltica]
MNVAIAVVAALLLVGVLLRQAIAPLRWLFIPASVVAGFVGLLLVQICLRSGDESLVGWAEGTSSSLSGWPGPLISVVFAAMMLQSADSSGGPIDRSTSSRVARQGLMVWIIVFGETFVGLLATATVIQPLMGSLDPSMAIPNSFGMLIETGFAGGHGTAGAMGVVLGSPTIGLDAGLDLGMLMATCGLVYGVVSGIVWINFGSRLGWFNSHLADKSDDDGPEGDVARKPIGFQVTGSETIDPLLLQAVWIGIAIGIGMLSQAMVQGAADWIDASWGWGEYAVSSAADSLQEAESQLTRRMSASTLLGFPLFIYTMLAGWGLRHLMARFGVGGWLDNSTLQRLSASAMEVLVVAAITSLKIETVVTYALPFAILFLFGAIWTAVCLMLISRWVLPRENWFPLGLINYGMSTGTTATGFVLLRVVDPDLKSTAANDYALAVPISAPFIGGGLLTIALPLLVLERVSIWWPTLIIGAVVLSLIVIGRRWNRGK